MDNKYEIISFNKDDLIVKLDEKPKGHFFYVILKGRVVFYNDLDERNLYYSGKGGIIGLVSSILYSNYIANVMAVEDTEVVKVKISSITDITDIELLNKIYDYMYSLLEIYLSKYYTILAKNKLDLYNKDDIEIMANIYKNNGFTDTSYKLLTKYIELFQNSNDIIRVKELIKDIKPNSGEITHIEKNIYKFPKGYTLYTEIYSSNNIYVIQSGKIGVYSIVNSKQTINNIYTSGYIINGYSPKLEYKPLMTTAIVLEDSVISIISKDDLIKIIYEHKPSRTSLIKMISFKVESAIEKIKSFNENNLNIKLISIIYSILKIDTLFNIDAKKITLSHKIEDIKNILNIDNNEIYEELKNIKYLELDNSSNIIITNIEGYIKKYRKFIK
ncbi:cyclic nucleotide-binding domain-containing protein [uncultured Brachyspira sp.]|uniref:cyclic nucleotide-binding domain-containing protein n=1 Tax=uncultured Brachyspira sp. TaxID=221953 RepID=UPI0025E64DA6|nr:cyclic nucleotide-binding domain-containing protein [uncultured Brachyspira sp.]